MRAGSAESLAHTLAPADMPFQSGIPVIMEGKNRTAHHAQLRYLSYTYYFLLI